jgi:hypothetical protein
MARNPETTKLRNQVVRLFNKGKTLSEIGAELGFSRGAAGRLILEARQMGIPTVCYTQFSYSDPHVVAARRSHAVQRAALGDVAYYEMMCRRAALARQARQTKAEGRSPE